MDKVKIKLNRNGVKEMLRSQAMMDACKKQANRVVKKCGSGYDVSCYTGANRVNAMVYTTTYEAQKDNRKNNTILKAVGK